MSRLHRSKKWKHSLSLCMIVKNEAATLEKCLRYARPFVDEMVIVDTGSTDGTREIAQRYADVYDEIEWPDSFSEARNHSYDLASGDFIMYLDGDEHLPDARQWRSLRRTLADDIAALQLRVVNVMDESSLLASDRFWQIRVMRNHPTVRFEGRVHNQIATGIERYRHATGKVVRRLPADIIHVGYSYDTERMREKYTPRIELLQAEFEEPRSEAYGAYYGYQLAVVWDILMEYERVLEVLPKVDLDLLTDDNRFYTHLLGTKAAIATGQPELALLHGEGMFAVTHAEPAAYYLTGLALLKAHKVHDGMLMILEAISINRQNNQARFTLNDRRLVGVVADLCEEAGLKRHAALCRQVLEQSGGDEALVMQLVVAMKQGFALADQKAAQVAAA